MVTPAIEPISLLWLGLVLGLRHASDADHVVAVGAIASRTGGIRPAIWLGVCWGLGHTLTLLVVAGGIALLDLVVPPRLGIGLELCVAVALVVLGALNVRSHRHDGALSTVRGPWQAFAVGLVHGLAGSAAVALLVVATVGQSFWVVGYLLVFGLGTLIGMAFISSGLAIPVVVLATHSARGARRWRIGAGMVSVVMGLWLVYQIGWIDGFFLASPTWTPY